MERKWEAVYNHGWYVEGVAPNGGAIAISNFNISEEDARLIAAAPDLLSSLKECAMELRQLHTHHYPKCEGGCPTEVYIARANEVIARAEGKE